MDTETLDLNAISMLDPAALDRLTEWAGHARGGILEIGSYTGGSTIALARGNAGKNPHAVIECGGSHAHHKNPSDDIIADWRRNMQLFGFEDAALMCEGWSYYEDVRAKALSHTGKIGFLFIDADGNLGPAFRSFASHMSADCLLALDDYWSPGAEEKAAMVKPFIDMHVAAGRFIPETVECGTWFGRISGQEALDYFAAAPAFRHETGFAFATEAPHGEANTLTSQTASRLRLFEDGVELGPAHAMHADIRTIGGGRFSHWGEGPTVWLYMSSSDNTDPRFNGRLYTASIDGERILI